VTVVDEDDVAAAVPALFLRDGDPAGELEVAIGVKKVNDDRE